MERGTIVVEEYEKLGTYFVHFNVLERTGITFGRFCELVESGTWQNYYAEQFAS